TWRDTIGPPPRPRQRRRPGSVRPRPRPDRPGPATIRPMPATPHDPASDPTRFFFVHLQKTAGTSLLIRLGNQFTPEQIYPDDSDGDKFGEMPQFDIPQLEARWAARAPEIRVVTGHFPLCTAELLGVPFT